MVTSKVNWPETVAEDLEQMGNYLDYAELNFRVVDRYAYGHSSYDEHYGWFRLLLAAENGDLQS